MPGRTDQYWRNPKQTRNTNYPAGYNVNSSVLGLPHGKSNEQAASITDEELKEVQFIMETMKGGLKGV